MTPPPDTIDRAFELMKAGYIETLVSNAADAFVAGEVRASRQLGIGLNFSLINSRAVSLTRAYRETLERFGGSDVTIVDEAGRISRQFKPWLNDAVRADKEQIGKIIDNAIREGKPLREVEQALDEVFAMREHDARSTAFRETKMLFNKGTDDRFRSVGIRRAIWHHMDPQQNPRPEHQARDGQVYDIDDPVWYEQDLWYCRCWKEPILEGAAGSAI